MLLCSGVEGAGSRLRMADKAVCGAGWTSVHYNGAQGPPPPLLSVVIDLFMGADVQPGSVRAVQASCSACTGASWRTSSLPTAVPASPPARCGIATSRPAASPNAGGRPSRSTAPSSTTTRPTMWRPAWGLCAAAATAAPLLAPRPGTRARSGWPRRARPRAVRAPRRPRCAPTRRTARRRRRWRRPTARPARIRARGPSYSARTWTA